MPCIFQNPTYIATTFTTRMLQTRYFFGYYALYATA